MVHFFIFDSYAFSTKSIVLHDGRNETNVEVSALTKKACINEKCAACQEIFRSVRSPAHSSSSERSRGGMQKFANVTIELFSTLRGEGISAPTELSADVAL
jgi:hypothetical protein